MTHFRMTLVGALAAAVAFTGLVSALPTSADDLDLQRIFRCIASDPAGIERCDEARSLILANCTSCHSFVPIVTQQFDQQGWDGLFARHRGRVPQLSDDQVDRMKAYLVASFNPQQPPPDLPEALRELWTGN